MHLILVLSNGTTKDAGYVGVEVEEDTFTVTFMDYDHRILKEQTVNKGGNATAPAAPTRDGYTFAGWNRSYTNVTADLVVYALYEENESEAVTYTVKFVDYDGSVIDTQIVKEGEDAVAPAAPTREGYNFVGWDKNFTNVRSDLTVKAMYEEIPITEPTIIIDTITAKAGDTSIAVKVSLANNPGIYSIGFNTNYDSSVLTLKSVIYSTEFGGTGMTPPLSNNFLVSWFNNTAVADVVKDGSFVTFVFDVSADAASGSVAIISIVPNTQEFYNAADNEVPLNIVNGGIIIQ